MGNDNSKPIANKNTAPSAAVAPLPTSGISQEQFAKLEEQIANLSEKLDKIVPHLLDKQLAEFSENFTQKTLLEQAKAIAAKLTYSNRNDIAEANHTFIKTKRLRPEQETNLRNIIQHYMNAQ